MRHAHCSGQDSQHAVQAARNLQRDGRNGYALI